MSARTARTASPESPDSAANDTVDEAGAEALDKVAALDRAQAIVEFEPDGSISSANTNFLKIAGHSASDVIGRNLRTLVEPQYASSVDYARTWEDLRRGFRQVSNFTMKRADGSSVCLRMVHTPVLDASGSLSKIVSLVEDVSEEQVHVRQSKILDQALKNSSAAVMVVDTDLKVTFVNDATMKLFEAAETQFKQLWPDFEARAIIGTCIDVFHRNPEHQRALLRDPSKMPFVTEIKLVDLTVRLYVTINLDAQGRYVGNSLEWRDITEEKARAIKDADSRGQLDAIDRAMARIEFEPDGTILKANENFLGALGYSAADVGGQASQLVRRSGVRGISGLQAAVVRPSGGALHLGRVPAVRKERQGGLDSGHLQPDPRPRWKGLQGGEVRDRHHRAEDGGP